MELRTALATAAASLFRTGRPTALLVRHAERDAITDLSRHEEAMLTDNGHACAAAAGRRFAEALAGNASGAFLRTPSVGHDVGVDVALFHSPVPRCRETAQGLHKGLIEAGRTARIVGERAAFGASYLKDPVGLARAYLKHGKGFVRAWFDGEIDPAWIDACEVVAQRQLHALQEGLRDHPLIVAVSHDWNIAALKEHALGLRFEDTGWPRFLDGVVVSVDQGRLHVDAVLEAGVEARVEAGFGDSAPRDGSGSSNAQRKV